MQWNTLGFDSLYRNSSVDDVLQMCTLDVEIISVALLHMYDYHNLIKWSDM